MRKPLPSVQLYTVRDQISQDLNGTLARLSNIGFTQVELFDFVDRATEYKRALLDNDLQVSSAHVFMLGNELEPILTAATEVGVKTLIHPLLSAENWQSKDQISNTANELAHIANIASDYGITIGYHNHAWELESKIDGFTALEFFEKLLPAKIILEVDVYWTEIGGESAPTILKNLGDRVQFLHIKDGFKIGGTAKQVPAGQGEIALNEAIKVAPQAVPVAEFDEYGGDIFEGLTNSLAFIKQAQQ